MIRNPWLVCLSLALLVTVSISTSEKNTNGSRILHNIHGLLQSAIKWYRNENTIVEGRTTTDFSTMLNETSEIEFNDKPIELDGSLVLDASISFSISRRAAKHDTAVRDERQGVCTCTIVAPATTCTITCTTYETRCGQTCTVYTVFSATRRTINIAAVLTTTIVTETTGIRYGPGCPGVPCVTLSTTTTTTVTTYPFSPSPAVLAVVASFAFGIGIGTSVTPTSVVENGLAGISTFGPSVRLYYWQRDACK